MIVYNGELIVGGTFTKIGNLTVNGIAAYNGTTWRALGSGVLNGSFDTGVLALATYGGELIAAGEFETAGGGAAMSIARWNGTRWASLGTGLTNNGRLTTISALSTFAGELVAGGSFNNAGGVAVSDVARWNGTSWQAMDVGLDGPVYSFGNYGGELIAGGSLVQVSGDQIRGVARWNGTRWAPLAASPPDIFGTVYCLPIWNGVLYPGGSFSTAGSASVDSIAAWNGSAWLDVPGLIFDDTLSPNVRSLAVWNGELVMGGLFQATDDFTFISPHIIEWSGGYPRDLPVSPNGAVLAMLPLARGANIPDDLIVAGSFTDMYFSSDPHNRVALLTSITDANGRITRPLGNGFNNTVWSLARFNGSTIAAGDFTSSGATPINRIARFDGTNWVPFDAIGADGSVRVLKSYTGTAGRIHLLMGGSFTSVAGITANRIAQYTFNTVTPGTSWSGLDPGFNGRVDAVERFGGVTFAAGQFTATSTGTPLNRISLATSAARGNRSATASTATSRASSSTARTSTPAARSPRPAQRPSRASPAGTAPTGPPSTLVPTATSASSASTSPRSSPAARSPASAPVPRAVPASARSRANLSPASRSPASHGSPSKASPSPTRSAAARRGSRPPPSPAATSPTPHRRTPGTATVSPSSPAQRPTARRSSSGASSSYETSSPRTQAPTTA